MASKRNEPCPCGSGKRYKKCCGLKGEEQGVFQGQRVQQDISSDSSVADLLKAGAMAAVHGRFAEAESFFRQAADQNPENVVAHINLGLALHDQGKFAEAEASLRKAARLDPDLAEVHNNLGMVLRSSGKTSEAETSFRQAVRLKPGYAKAHNNLGLVLHDQAKFTEAEASLRQALKLNPDLAETHINLGMVLNSQGKIKEAIASYLLALKLRPDYAEAHYNLGIAYGDQGKLSESENSLRQAIKLKPDYTEAYNNLGLTLYSQGRMAEAETCFRQALKLNPDSAKVYKSLSMFRKPAAVDDIVIGMEELYQRGDLPEEDRIDLGFALGKTFENLGEYDKSFGFIRDANQLKRRSYRYSIQEDQELLERIKNIFSADFFVSQQHAGNPDNTPIFIVGMPRSGTTLVEQIIASHPLVFGAGELLFLPDIANKICSEAGAGKFPEGILQLGSTEFNKMALEYVAKIRNYSDSAQHITDKLPHNFLFVGLIRAILPAAKVIHCTRDPMDNCLSVYKTDFKEQLHRYAYDLVETGQYYNLYLDLMAHWEKVLPGYLYNISYEEMVADQEKQTRELLDFCGLAWDEACLAFHKTKRKVVTASVAQVRQPMNRDSVELWRRYEKQLAPLKEVIVQQSLQ